DAVPVTACLELSDHAAERNEFRTPSHTPQRIATRFRQGRDFVTMCPHPCIPRIKPGLFVELGGGAANAINASNASLPTLAARRNPMGSRTNHGEPMKTSS